MNIFSITSNSRYHFYLLISGASENEKPMLFTRIGHF